nr:prepilin peptidase [Geodermatophilaceae bacterium]
VLGAVAAVLLLAARRVSLRTPIAFGPAMLAGWLLVAVWAAATQ